MGKAALDVLDADNALRFWVPVAVPLLVLARRQVAECALLCVGPPPLPRLVVVAPRRLVAKALYNVFWRMAALVRLVLVVVALLFRVYR